MSLLIRQVLRLAREPFVHFMVLGSLMFVVNAIWGDEQRGINRDITINATDVARLEALWQSQYSRPPSATERETIIADHVREEVLFREARALGLGDDDLIVRRRLVQKFLFFSEDLMDGEMPSDQVLGAYYNKHQDRYRASARTTFSHVYFSNDSRGNGAKQAAIDLMTTLQTNEEDWQSQGDPFMLQREYIGIEDKEITRRFGQIFTSMLNGLAKEGWYGPVQSAYGWHAVKVHERSTPALPRLSDIRETVIVDFKLEKKEEASQAFYQSVLDRYVVSIASASK